MTAAHTVTTLGALTRAVPRGPVVLAIGAALGLVVVGAQLGGHSGAILGLQASAIALAGAAVTLLDEPRAALEALPTTLARRRALLLAAGLPALALIWTVLLALGDAQRDELSALTLQLTAVTALALGLGARGDHPGRALAGVALAFGTARLIFGPQLFPPAAEAAHWTGARGWWAGAACMGLALLVAGSRDAAGRMPILR